MTDIRTKHVNARVAADLKQALADKAKETDRSESWIISEALKAFLFPKPRLPQRSD